MVSRLPVVGGGARYPITAPRVLAGGTGTDTNGTKLRSVLEEGTPSRRGGMSIPAQGDALGMCPILDWSGTLKGFSKIEDSRGPRKRRLNVLLGRMA